MTDLGEQVLVALADQGFAVLVSDEEVRILSLDRRRLHVLPADPFLRNGKVHVTTLRLIVTGLEYLEGFVPPDDFRDL